MTCGPTNEPDQPIDWEAFLDLMIRSGWRLECDEDLKR